MTFTSLHVARLGWTLDAALIAVASVVIFLPSARNPGLKDAVFALWILHGGPEIYAAWKAGLLTKTPRQVYEAIRVTGPPKRRRFEHLAFFMGLVGCVVANWF